MKSGLLALIALSCLSMPSAEASVVTFDYTATVTSLTGVSVPGIGTTVHASVTFDTAALPWQSTPTSANYANPIVSLSYNSQLVPLAGSSVAIWNNYTPAGGTPYIDTFYINAMTTAGETFDLFISATLASPPSLLTSTGLPNQPPNLALDTEDFFRFNDGKGGSFRGDITSITMASPVPEASTWAMLLLGFAGVGCVAYRRREQRTLAA